MTTLGVDISNLRRPDEIVPPDGGDLTAAPAAGADLYRWVDPESGSVKFSSYPPPWHGDPAKARRSPKVEVIPAGRATPAPPEAAAVPDAGLMAVLEIRRKDMLQRIPALAGQAGSPGGAQALTKHLDAYKVLSDEIDKLDPLGAAARRIELQALVQKSMTRNPP